MSYTTLSRIVVVLRGSALAQSQTLYRAPPALTTCRPYGKKQHADKRSKRALGPSIGETEEEVFDFGKLRKSMDAAVNSLKWQYSQTLITRVTPALLERVSVEFDGRNVPLKEVAQVGLPNPQNLIINFSQSPKAMEPAVKAIRNMGLNLNPIAERNVLRMPVPRMTREQRENLVKLAKSSAEKTKVHIRRVRQKGISDSRKKRKEVSEDVLHRIEKQIEHLTDEYMDNVDKLLKGKSTELMSL